MGFRLRKSVNLGGVRVNLSKSGVGYSFGTKGMRVTKCANGHTRKTVGIPGTGISYVTESGKSKKGIYNEKKAKKVGRSEIIAISADRVIVRDYALDTEKEVSKAVIVFMNCIVRFSAYMCIAFGLLFTLIIPILGLFFIALGIIFLSGNRQFKQALEDMKAFEKEEK